ncbi:MAG: glycosyltransferase family 9 protein [Anaerolineales bacterium]|nr:glycosyltransferase family 9 protein [Anaerolineales bacterium]
MLQNEMFINTAARLVRIPFQTFLRPRDFVPPKKALILKPCCVREAILTTPLLYQLRMTYPKAQIDWAISEWARPAIATNSRLNEIIDTGRVGLPDCSWSEIKAFITRLRELNYDTCFIPSESPLLAYIAWRANIPQRVGIDAGGKGFAHTISVSPHPQESAASAYLRMAQVLGIDTTSARSEFAVTSEARIRITDRLMDQLGWQGIGEPLVVFHPGGGSSPTGADERIRWPVERFARLGNFLVRDHKAKVIIVGGANDLQIANAVAGLMSSQVFNLANQLSLVELGALCEVANLYVGNNTGPTYIAAAVSCPTLAIYGPDEPNENLPFANNDHLLTLWKPYEGEFRWEKGISTEDAKYEAVRLLRGVRRG